jgi:hypothetical protein
MEGSCGHDLRGSCERCARGSWTITRGSAIPGATAGPRETYYSNEISGEFDNGQPSPRRDPFWARWRALLTPREAEEIRRAHEPVVTELMTHRVLDEVGPAPTVEEYDAVKRATAKAASRAEDSRRLAAGEVTREELARENSLFPPGTRFKITSYGGPPRKRR